MAFLVTEGGVEKRLHYLDGYVRSHYSSTKTENVDVVVFHHLVGRVGLMSDCSPNATKLVGGHTCSRSRATDDDPSVSPSFQYSSTSTGSHIRIINWVGRVGSEIEGGVPCGHHRLDHDRFQSETGVIGSNGYSHEFHAIRHLMPEP